MSDTNINAYKLELQTAQLDLDRAKSRVAALEEYIEAVEPSKKGKKKDTTQVEETIKATDTVNDTRPVVEDSITELPDEGEKIKVKTSSNSRKGKK